MQVCGVHGCPCLGRCTGQMGKNLFLPTVRGSRGNSQPQESSSMLLTLQLGMPTQYPQYDVNPLVAHGESNAGLRGLLKKSRSGANFYA